MNCVTLIGRLVKDPELHTFTNGTSYVLGVVAIQYSNEKAEFIPFKAIGGVADILVKHFAKGNRIGIQGELKAQSIGEYKSSVIVEIKRVYFIDPKTTKNRVEIVENDDFSYYDNGGY